MAKGESYIYSLSEVYSVQKGYRKQAASRPHTPRDPAAPE